MAAEIFIPGEGVVKSDDVIKTKNALLGKAKEICKKHSNSYLIRYPHLYGHRIDEYKWVVLIEDLFELFNENT